MTASLRLLILCLVAPTACGAQDMPLTQVLLPDSRWELVSSGHRFTEGPAADNQGNLFFSDVPANRIHRVDRQGAVTVFAEDTAATNGLMFGPDGRLYGCRNGDRQIVAYTSDGRHAVIASDVDSNDIVVNSEGGIYFTDPPHQRVWYLNPGGTKRVVARDLKPNGLILWPHQGTLVVTDSQDTHLWTFRIAADGGLSYKERYYMPLQLPSGAKTPGSDGMTVDTAGRLYVATRAGIQMFDPTGRLGGTILKPQNRFLSNVTFGGLQRDYLYATCSDKVYRRKTRSVGAVYNGGKAP
ncbi:MAG: SMP-30/gluconolactonase/LRE family protein [Planctomycetaceae bacterium]